MIRLELMKFGRMIVYHIKSPTLIFQGKSCGVTLWDVGALSISRNMQGRLQELMDAMCTQCLMEYSARRGNGNHNKSTNQSTAIVGDLLSLRPRRSARVGKGARISP
mmetsp:Transcript_261/g.414  ORF Transcript_261/g.414 Transcript_261/m.414 type:complete len:107 (+) Transcript_261:778-1098(+)